MNKDYLAHLPWDYNYFVLINKILKKFDVSSSSELINLDILILVNVSRIVNSNVRDYYGNLLFHKVME